jgi:hypothetical protein
MLSACSTAPKQTWQTRLVKSPSPPSLMPRRLPTLSPGATWGDLAAYALALEEFAQTCEADKAAARESMQ